MADEHDRVDPPHVESGEDSDGDVKLDLEDAPLADEPRPEAVPNDMPESG
jgi:hypothetical protein